MQEEALKLHRPLVVVGTPGRLAELSRAGALLTHHTGVPLPNGPVAPCAGSGAAQCGITACLCCAAMPWMPQMWAQAWTQA